MGFPIPKSLGTVPNETLRCGTSENCKIRKVGSFPMENGEIGDSKIDSKKIPTKEAFKLFSK